MSGFFKGLFGSGATAQPTASQPSAAQGINVQTSVLGKVIPIVYGTTRIAGNLILYGNFESIAVMSQPTASGGGGGKGGIFGGGQAAPPGSVTYNYFAAFAFALCEGPISTVNRVWRDKDVLTLSALDMGIAGFGNYGQGAWSLTVSWDMQVGDSVATNIGNNQTKTSSAGISTITGNSGAVTSGNAHYNGIAYVSADRYALGSSAVMPNHSYEILGPLLIGSGIDDADPSQVIMELLTNEHYGLGFPSALIGSFTTWSDYCFAAGLFVSPAYVSQTAMTSIIEEMCIASNTAAFWSSGKLNFTPYGDEDLSGNGHTYTAPSAPLFSLTDDDFIARPQSSEGNAVGPVVVTRKRPADKMNSIKIEYLDRSNDYNPGIAYANDQALIDAYGLRTNGSSQLHLFCDGTPATLCAQLRLRRELICNVYHFDLDQRYIVLDPMDIVAITDSALGLTAQWVRIIEITENDDGSLSISAEEYSNGTGRAPSYTFASISGFLQNRDASPGPKNPPVFMEPSFSLAHGLEVWVAASAPTSAHWGGADVYISSDDLNYSLAGRINGSARVGRLTATLATYPLAISGLTIDQTHTLSVDLTQSNGVLTTTTTSQANNLASLCWVDGEFIAYATATLTATNKYNLTYLVRGAYDSDITAHNSVAVGATGNFVRLDGGVFKIPYTSDRVGQTLYVKFLSFNTLGGGQISLATAQAHSYTIRGDALTFPLDDVTNLSAGYIGNILSLDWSEIEDFRPVLYEIRKGDSWDGGQFIVRQAHPPFKTFGNGTYWVAAYSQPSPNVVVYSDNPQSIVVTASNVTANIVATREEDPTWAGTLSGDIVKVGVTLQTNGINGGTYTIPSTDRITITAPFACAVLIDWASVGVPLSNSFFQYHGGAIVSSGSASVTGLQIFSGSGRLYGNTVVDNLLTTFGMGAGQPITGTGISSGCEILSVTSTTSLMLTIAATTGSTISASTQTLSVFPDLAIGLMVESSNISSGAHISAIPTLSSITMTTTAIHSSTANIDISIDWFQTFDLFGAGAAQFADVYPEIRMSQNGGSSWGNWQRYVSGYYLGNGFDARIQMRTVDIQSVGVLETMRFQVDVPDRWDHYNSVSVSSLGSTITFRPDGMTTAAFNGGPQGSTDSKPSLVGTVVNGSPGDSVAFSSITLSNAVVTTYTSTGGAVAKTANIIAKGY